MLRMIDFMYAIGMCIILSLGMGWVLRGGVEGMCRLLLGYVSDSTSFYYIFVIIK